jgi:hypothetical protein
MSVSFPEYYGSSENSVVSFQLTILKVLDGQTGGRAGLVDLKRYVAILMTSGPEWTARMKRLGTRAPQLDIFGQALVHRDRDGWQITDAGRAFLALLEAAAPAAGCEAKIPAKVESTSASPAVLHVGPIRRVRHRRRRRVSDQARRSA